MVKLYEDLNFQSLREEFVIKFFEKQKHRNDGQSTALFFCSIPLLGYSSSILNSQSGRKSDVDTSNLGLKTSSTLTKKDIPKHLQFQPHKTQTQRSSSTHEGGLQAS